MEPVVCGRLNGASVPWRNWLWTFVLCVLISRTVVVSAVVPKRSSPTDAIDRLSKVFGISKIPARIFHRSPPQYMTELYTSITDSGGLTTKQSPFNADVVRSFPDKDSIHRMHFHYNVSNYSEEDGKVLQAEFHIFKMKARPSMSYENRPPHLVQVKVYQVVDIDRMFSSEGLTLLDARKISAHVHGWQKFSVKKAVESWLNNSDINYGLLVTTTSLRGDHVNGSYIRFAQRNEHHDSKQPILVVFTDEGLQRRPNYISPQDAEYLQMKRDIEEEEEIIRQRKMAHRRQAIRFLNEKNRARMIAVSIGQEDSVLLTALRSKQGRTARIKRSFHNQNQQLEQQNWRLTRKKRSFHNQNQQFERPKRKVSNQNWRKKRSPKDSKKRKGGNGRKKRTFEGNRYRSRRTCSKQQMYVDFEEIGWAGWIISPKGYNAYHCAGECPFPLGQSQKPTNHATVQSIVHALRVGKDVGTPCCVPNKLYSISLLYFDDDENVILKQYDEMVAATCGCH